MIFFFFLVSSSSSSSSASSASSASSSSSSSSFLLLQLLLLPHHLHSAVTHFPISTFFSRFHFYFLISPCYRLPLLSSLSPPRLYLSILITSSSYHIFFCSFSLQFRGKKKQVSLFLSSFFEIPVRVFR